MSLAKIVKTTLPFWIAAIAYWILRTAMVGGIGGSVNPDIMENPFVNASFIEKYATITLILQKYFILLFYPHPLSCDYSFNQIPLTTFGNPMVLLGLAIYIFMAVWVILKIIKRNELSFFILLYLIPLSLTTNILFNIGAPMGERFLYVSSWGFCLAVGYLLSVGFRVKELRDLRSRTLLLAGFALLIVLFSIKTNIRNPDWKDNMSLFGKDVNSVPNSAKIHYYYANTKLIKYLDSDKASEDSQVLLDVAEKHFTRSVEINPKFHTAMYNLGRVNSERQNGVKAEEYLLRTLQLQPRHIISHELIAEVYGRLLNQPDKALDHLNLLINEAGEATAKNYQALGIVYGMMGDHPNAAKAFENSLKQDPNNAGTLLNLGITFQQLGDIRKGQEYMDKAFELDPSLKR